VPSDFNVKSSRSSATTESACGYSVLPGPAFASSVIIARSGSFEASTFGGAFAAHGSAASTALAGAALSVAFRFAGGERECEQ